MADDKDKSVLASRVLSFLKRKVGNGLKPTAAETKAAIAAVTLLSKAFPSEANDPQTFFSKLKQIARSNNSHDMSSNEQSQTELMRLQMQIRKQTQMLDILKGVMEKYDSTAKNVIQNIGR